MRIARPRPEEPIFWMKYEKGGHTYIYKFTPSTRHKIGSVLLAQARNPELNLGIHDAIILSTQVQNYRPE